MFPRETQLVVPYFSHISLFPCLSHTLAFSEGSAGAFPPVWRSSLWGGGVKPAHAHRSAWKHSSAAAESLQSCLTLCDPRNGSPLGSPTPGILQARTLESVAISFSNAWKWKVKVKSLSRARLFMTPWTAAHPVSLSMDFPGKSTGVGCHCLLREILLRVYICDCHCVFTGCCIVPIMLCVVIVDF